MRINYVIASWDGDRHGHEGPWYPVLEHLENLGKLGLSIISQITVGCPRWDGEDKRCIDALHDLEFCGGAPVVVLDIENGGRSYGQYSQIFGHYRTSFDLYIVAEDDFIPILPRLDVVLLELFEEKQEDFPGCGYLCGVERAGVACVSNGIISGQALEDVWNEYKCLPCLGRHMGGPQYMFSRAIESVGYSIRDYTDKYRSLFWRHTGNEVWQFGCGPDIWVPIEFDGRVIQAPRLPPIPEPVRSLPWERRQGRRLLRRNPGLFAPGIS